MSSSNPKFVQSQSSSTTVLSASELTTLSDHIKAWGKSLGFQQVGICDVDVKHHERAYKHYIEMAYQGQMDYLSRNIEKRLAPEQLHPGTCRIISVRMNYLPPDASFAKNLANNKSAYISRYALGRDYHKVMRQRLKQLGEKIKSHLAHWDNHLNFRPFVDSAPVLEHAIAEKAGIGWTGKHTLTLNEEAGSWFFLGELFINIPLPVDQAVKEQCGTCTACISICPTKAIVAPYKLDARRCISYLTIEHKGEIPLEFREAIGNRVYGCDDCQLVCPWNRYADVTEEKDFFAREKLNNQSLLSLFTWTEQAFLSNTEGSPIRRIGFQSWRRNLSIGLGNADYDSDIVNALQSALDQTDDPVLQAHFKWAINTQNAKAHSQVQISNKRLKARLIRTVKKGLPRDA